MASIYVDGDRRRIYEVPVDSNFTVDGSGYRIYVPNDPIPRIGELVSLNLLTEIWSPYVDWRGAGNDWATLAFVRSGGALRPDGSNAATDINFTNMWQLVLADYEHTLIIQGNLFPDPGTPLTDNARLTELATINVNTSANLLGIGDVITQLGRIETLVDPQSIRDAMDTPTTGSEISIDEKLNHLVDLSEADEVKQGNQLNRYRRGTVVPLHPPKTITGSQAPNGGIVEP